MVRGTQDCLGKSQLSQAGDRTRSPSRAQQRGGQSHLTLTINREMTEGAGSPGEARERESFSLETEEDTRHVRSILLQWAFKVSLESCRVVRGESWPREWGRGVQSRGRRQVPKAKGFGSQREA